MSDAKFRLAHWSDAQVGLFLFVALWLTYGFFVGDFAVPNALTRMALVLELIHNHAPAIDDFARFPLDKVAIGAQVYADKPPALSFTALPFVAGLVWAAHALNFAALPIDVNKLTPFYSLATAVAAFFTGGLFTAAAAAMFYRLARHWRASRSAALFGTLGFALASPMLGWAGVFFSHATAGACLFLAFGCIALGVERAASPPRDALCGLAFGLLLAWAAAVEPTAALAAALIAVFGLWTLRGLEMRRGATIAGATVIGVIAGLLPTLIYNAAVFGTVFHSGLETATGIAAMPRGIGAMPQGIASLSWPRPARLYGLLFGEYRGIVWVAPLLFLAPLGYWASFRALPRPAWIALLVVPIAHFLLIAGYAYWWGGWSTGPRFVVPSLAFLILPLVFLWQRAGEGARLVLAGIALAGAGAALACASVGMATPEPYPSPMLSYILPLFVGGFIRNALTLAGLRGFITLAALPVLWLAVAAAVAAVARRQPPAEAPVAAGASARPEHARPTPRGHHAQSRKPGAAQRG